MDALISAAFSALVKVGRLEVITAKGSRLLFGDGSGIHTTVRFRDAGAERALLLNPELKTGELFTDGRLTVEQGTVYDFLLMAMQGAREASEPWVLRLADEARVAATRVFARNDPRRAARNVAHHYDLGDDLYALFLDPDWQYSCAYFEHPDQSLVDAQLAKKRHVAAKLLIEPGNSVLDIGSGWGGLALHLAELCGADRVLGVTLSTEQIERARRRAIEHGLAERVTFQLQDYRQLAGRFDRIVSVGMFEHVGLAFYGEFFRAVRRLLADDGVALIHTIASPDTPGPTNPWIRKYIFPGGHIPSLSDIAPHLEKAGLVLTDLETLGPHYALTLQAWRRNFMSRRDEAKRMFDERFCRMWEFYLSLSEAAFRTDDITVFQLQLARRRGAVPLTRSYMEERERLLRGREPHVQNPREADPAPGSDPLPG
ncbi:cyclopropane-fatty-acyl-phospholipid synthase family protein [Phenylobacterium sp.]|uniref:cyclopropane-fatty-acyl-phospholipid synthase family protein n=1 Tax=Phenylobacterium sp. TaxID=1871053 RepID=UPI002F3F681A